MNLHEETLLKYLMNPLCIAGSTELLKHTNKLIANGTYYADKQTKTVSLSYNTGRV